MMVTAGDARWTAKFLNTWNEDIGPRWTRQADADITASK